MSATKLNITIEQGADFSLELDVGTALNGATVAAGLRRSFCGNALVDFTCTNVAAGKTTLSLTAVQTAALSVSGAREDEREAPLGFYDVNATLSAVVTRTHQGAATLSRKATA